MRPSVPSLAGRCPVCSLNSVLFLCYQKYRRNDLIITSAVLTD
ncbi:hypothetical protein CLOSTHATH_03732 [Hungatella hathewayi DSM 13479]|uniref:Uncharacterized protein n=1 Tax=Hungatella hathewayi DSM 13479 TaxID=566550 RepID=D3AJE1_9FIRM|nr:hypothetical protein CLOSTHATH_03732 [Hungatella hathewayi DSM 13479]